MKIATWNVNSLGARLPQVLDWLAQARPDLLGLQELKLADDKFPLAELQAAGWHAVFHGQKTYNGVALLTKKRWLEKLVFGVSGVGIAVGIAAWLHY